MLLNQMDKYIKEINIVDTIKSIKWITIQEAADKLVTSDMDERKRILSLLNKNTREEIEKLLEGGLI